MKKIYLSPEILIQKIVLQQMIATSTPTVTMKDDEDAVQDGEVLSRRRYQNVWDEEEYDDEEDW